MKFQNNLFFLLLVVFLSNGCNSPNEKSSPEIQAEPTSSDLAAQEDDPLTAVKTSIENRLNAYYADLSAEKIAVEKYYAPTVEKFFKQSRLSRAQIATSLENGFKAVENRTLSVDSPSLQVSQKGANFVAIFSGKVAYVRSATKESISESFRNQVTFNSDLQIIGYESLAATQNTQTPQIRTKQDKKISKPNSSTDRELFASRLGDFLQAWEGGNATKLSSFIDPQRGFYFINRPGAIDAVDHGKSFEEVFKKAYTPYTAQMLKDASCEPQFEELPKFDCDGFSKNGCFVVQTNSYNRASVIMKSLTNSKIGRFSQQMDTEVSQAEQRVDYQVLITDKAISMGWGKIDNEWYLLFLDIATYDCSA